MSRFTGKLENKTVIIIGGTGGIGMAVAAALLEFGANVIITGSRQSRLDEQSTVLRSQLASSSPSSSASLTGFVCDLGSEDVETNLAHLATQVKDHLSTASSPQLNHIIYAAGDSLSQSPISEVTQAKFQSALHMRAVCCMLALKHLLPLLDTSSHKSSVILTSGSLCEKPIAGGWVMSAFIAAGLTGMTRQLAADHAPVRFNCVCPGLVDTGLWSGMTEEQRKGFYESIAKGLPTGAVGSADDVAEAYLYLMRDTNVTGSVVHTNGGAFL